MGKFRELIESKQETPELNEELPNRGSIQHLFNFDDMKKQASKLLNKTYKVSQGPYGADPILDYYKSELNVSVHELIYMEGTILKVQITTYFGDDIDSSDAKKKYRDILSGLTKIFGTKVAQDTTVVWTEDPDGSGWEGFGTDINIQFDMKEIAKTNVEHELKVLEKSAVMQIIKNSDSSDIIASMISGEFCQEVQKMIQKSRISNYDIEMVYK